MAGKREGFEASKANLHDFSHMVRFEDEFEGELLSPSFSTAYEYHTTSFYSFFLTSRRHKTDFKIPLLSNMSTGIGDRMSHRK